MQVSGCGGGIKTERCTRAVFLDSVCDSIHDSTKYSTVTVRGGYWWLSLYTSGLGIPGVSWLKCQLEGLRNNGHRVIPESFGPESRGGSNL